MSLLHYGRGIYLIALISCLCACDFPAITKRESSNSAIRIDHTVRYQMIRGFGGYGAKRVWWAPPPHYDDEFVGLLVDDLGVSIIRDSIPISFEPRNDNDDPFDLDLEQFNVSDDYPGAEGPLINHLPYLKALHEAGVQTFITSVWSPPPWMKYNNHHDNGSERETSAPPYETQPGPNTNQLRTDLFEEFAEYCVAYIKLLKRETGIELHAISLQNEPRFSQWYASAVYSPESLRELIKVVRARFEREGISTRIFMPEDVSSTWHIRRFLQAVLQDPLAREYVDIFAVHGYGADGVLQDDESPRKWQETFAMADSAGKELWMTETSGFDWTGIDGGLELAKSIYNALHFGNVAAWVYFQFSDDRGAMLVNGGEEKTVLYYVSKQFYRHIRPGAVRLKISTGNEHLLALAFTHTNGLADVVVLINTSGETLNTALEGADRQFTGYVTSRTQMHDRLSRPVVSGSRFEVPAQSVMTLVASD